MKLSEIGEFGLIERLKSRLATRNGVRHSIGDDAAILEAISCPIITMDALSEGAHFRRDWTSARSLGRKAMAVNVSDLAASGARPVAAFVSLCVSPRDDVEWIEELYGGFEDVAGQFDFTIAGGDTVKSRGDCLISIALVGEVLNAARGPILRSSAQIGDVLLVSGPLGDSAAGFSLLQAENSHFKAPISDGTRQKLLKRHHEPQARLDWMKNALEIDADALHAALDLSDGLSGDAAHMARSSGVTLEIETERVPLSAACLEAAAALKTDARNWALSGGEDYELLLSIAPEKAEKLIASLEKRGQGTSQIIGKCVAPDFNGPRVVFREKGVIRETQAAWTHF